ncbi:helix-turn-helix domain-containing protein [Streptomyces pinistramenti]|uniref:helix-turn-helix domain-containing protein n=1 Tax=Streptomyces pinistramenti TaxID=2884812 RepID=UPI001D05DEEF|nr:helix-turn-helix transcriptional regulator [Streptomyces pinistramenti]MCB5910436.1 helix-turn-helix transcriptional regulator [Streptomyces pinistramenti]
MQQPTDSDASGVSADALRIYDTVHSSPGIPRTALRDLVPLPPEDTAVATDRLLELGLLESDEGDCLFAVATTSVVLRTCIAVARAATEGQRQAQRLASLVTNMDALRTMTGAGSTERLVNLEAVRQTIAQLAAQAQFEILTSQPGGPRPDEQLEESLGRTRGVLERGVKMRTLYQWSAQFSPTTTEYVSYLIGLGAEVRATHDSFMRLLVFDRKVALMSLKEAPHGALVVHEPDIVGFAVEAYERAWTASRPFPTHYVKDSVLATSDDIKLSIMRLLTEGHEVTAIGKRLGISQRTCQRHISEIMQRLGARNRLHAGYLISQKGLLDAPVSAHRLPGAAL